MQTNSIKPVLAQFASSASAVATLPEGCYVDPVDSLLRGPGSARPLIDIVLDGMGQGADGLATILTEASKDPLDPDTIRLAPDWLSTLITRTWDENTDPDLVRFSARELLDTMFTKSEIDPGDPDTVRLHG